MYLKHGLVALLALGPVSAAWAVPASEEGATRLKGVFQAYFGATDGVVTVTPKGETYDLVINPAPLLAQIPVEDFKGEIGPLTYHLTDNGDGTWGVTENQTMTWSFTIPGSMEHTGSAKIESTGIWDEALPGFREQTAVMTDYTVSSSQYMAFGEPMPGSDVAEADEPVLFSRDNQKTDRTEMKMTGKPGAAGGVDHEMTYHAEGMHQTAEYADLGGTGPMSFEVTSPSYDGTGQVKGARNDAILGLLAWFVAHPSQELIANSQDGLRDKLSAAMPLWDDMTMDLTLNDMKVVSPFGDFAASTIAVEFDLAGIEADGMFREKISVTGLTVPPAIVPAWAQPVLPNEVSFDFTASDFDLAAPVKMFIEGFDLTAPDPLGKLADGQMQAAFFGKGPIGLALAPSHIKGEGYEIGYEGDMQVTAGLPPTGKAKVTASGLDKIEAALSAAPPEEAQQPLMMLQMAKMLAKPGSNGESVWEIDASQPGAVSINGQSMGGPAPQQ